MMKRGACCAVPQRVSERLLEEVRVASMYILKQFFKKTLLLQAYRQYVLFNLFLIHNISIFSEACFTQFLPPKILYSLTALPQV